MRIATYNIWNSDTFWPLRLEPLCDEIKNLGADIIALQEVRATDVTTNNLNIAQCIANSVGYEYCEFQQYPGENEGMAILSKFH